MLDEFETYDDMADEGERYSRELQGWLETFSSGKKKRPDGEIRTKTKRLAWVRKTVELYRRAAAKNRDAA